MPAAKQYLATSKAGTNTTQTSESIAPTNSGRISLFIQNTGSNLGVLQFGNPLKGDGSDFRFAPGAWFSWDQVDTCPRESVNLGSEFGTTWAILEGNR